MSRTITLRKALQLKKTLSGEVSKASKGVSNNNCVRKTRVNPDIDVKELYEKWKEKTANLLELKTAITLANVSIYGKIVYADELKSSIAFYEGLDTFPFEEVYDGTKNVTEETIVFLSGKEVNEIISKLKVDLEETLDAIDAYNSTTTFTISF